MIRQIILVLMLLMLLSSSRCNAISLESTKVINASYILEKISRGESVYLDNVIIVGDLSSASLDLPSEKLTTGPNSGFFAKKIESEITIKNSAIYGNTAFRFVLFKNWINFDDSVFFGKADFSQCVFLKPASFAQSRFIKDLDFDTTEFSNEFYFNKAQSRGFTNFIHTEFDGGAYFLGSKFIGNANFLESQFNGDADFRRVDLDNVTFFADLLFPSPISGFACDWGSLKNRLDIDDEDNIYYHYRIWRLSSLLEQGRYSSMPIDILAWISCGFGVHPELPVIWSFILIISFALVFRRFNGIHLSPNLSLVTKKHRVLYKTRKISNQISFREALYFSALVFFLSQPPSYMQPIGKWRWRSAMMVETILGWLLITLFTVTLGHIMIR